MSKSKSKNSLHLSFGFDLTFAMNHVRFMISPELYVVQETLSFDIVLFNLLLFWAMTFFLYSFISFDNILNEGMSDNILV